MAERTINDVRLDNHEDRIKVLETASMNLVVAIEKQSLVVGLMAKTLMSGAGVIGFALVVALLNLILKRPIHV